MRGSRAVTRVNDKDWAADLWAVGLKLELHELCKGVLSDTTQLCLLPPQLDEQQGELLWLKGAI